MFGKRENPRRFFCGWGGGGGGEDGMICRKVISVRCHLSLGPDTRGAPGGAKLCPNSNSTDQSTMPRSTYCMKFI